MTPSKQAAMKLALEALEAIMKSMTDVPTLPFPWRENEAALRAELDHQGPASALDLRSAAHALEVAIRFAGAGFAPTAEEVAEWKVALVELRKAVNAQNCINWRM